MKAFFITLSLISISIFTIGCQSSLSVEDNSKEHILEPERPSDIPDPDLSAKLGYVRYTSEEVNEINNPSNEISINRIQMADTITKTILRSQLFEEAATLVTDKEVIIAYDVKSGIEKAKANETAMKTAKSMMPSFYKIYTTDNPTHMNDIHSLHLSTTDRKSELETIKKIIHSIQDE